MLDPFAHAERVTGCKQIALVDSWAACGVAAALSEVTGPHRYEFGAMPFPTVAVTLYGVRRHVLTVDGRVRRDGPVLPGRFRIGQPGRHITVDAVPAATRGKLLLMYLGPGLLDRVAADTGRAGPVTLLDQAWDTEDTFLHLMARRLAETMLPQALGCSLGCSLGRAARPDPLFAGQIAHTLALHLLDRHAAGPPMAPAGALPPAALARVVDFVRASPDLRCSLDEMAAVAGLSPSHFLRRFQAATGWTPHRFVLQERVGRARHLLASTDLPACSVALASGFSSQSHLGTAFRDITGMTPRQYRRTTRGS